MTSLELVNPRVRRIRASTCFPSSQDEMIDLISGDFQKAGMKPFSFVRQVLACCVYPHLLEYQTFNVDVRERAQTLLDACGERSVGSYTDSSGLDNVRQSVADFITSRDGVPCSASNIFIAGGSQRALMVMVKLLAGTEGDVPMGVLTPEPSPHTLPMLLDEAGVSLEPYVLNKEQGWAVHVDELNRSLSAARVHCKPKAIFISNPSNPTGHVQSRESIKEVIKFAAAEGLLLLVDEIYQDFIFEDMVEFTSYKKMLYEMGPPYSDTTQMAYFHSISSIGEGGFRAGYMELVNIDAEVKHFVDTMLCTDISTSVMGQLVLSLMVRPLKPGDPSYCTYTEEKKDIAQTLRRNCRRACEVLNNLPGVSCETVLAGIYLYPCVNVPTAVMKQAMDKRVEAGAVYCAQLLTEQAVLVGPSCSHGPPTGTYHFRLCILIPSDVLDEALSRIQKFHQSLLESDPTSSVLDMAGRTTPAAQTRIDLASGDPHSAGIAPVSFLRQVLAVCLYPDLLQDENLPLDVRQRAQQFLDFCPKGSVGVYSSSAVGMPNVLKQIAEFICRRDGGVAADPNNIIFNSGTQENLKLVFKLLSSGSLQLQSGLLVPGLYPHTLPGLLEYTGLRLVQYRPEPDQDWDMEELKRVVTEARGHCDMRALYICNPAIPSGHVQDRTSMESMIRFAAAERLFLLVQEVHQDCIFGPGIEFLSYKKVLREMGPEYSEHVELISFNSLSNGSQAECGLRGGYMELVNTDSSVAERMKVLLGFRSPPVLPQCALEIQVNPPKPGDPSSPTYSQEISNIHDILCLNARHGCEALNRLKGVACQLPRGGIFLYPQLDLPARFLREAKTLGQRPDDLYCQRFWDEAGVRVGAGSENGSHHLNIRLCFAASSDSFQDALSRLSSFHSRLHETYS
uniref:alanine transaminase n=1 Tax=Knipowitschia caucasica TaxID=637954 RepID=A0AAV2KXC5_KNICA